MKVTCPNCNAKIKSDSDFCNHCGSKIEPNNTTKPKRSKSLPIILILIILILGVSVSFYILWNYTDYLHFRPIEKEFELSYGSGLTLDDNRLKKLTGLKWESLDPSIASVSQNGTINAVDVGKTKVLAKKNGEILANYKVTIHAFEEEREMSYGEVYTINFLTKDILQALEWNTSDENIAKVEEGTITATGVGYVDIKGKTEKNNVISYHLNITSIPATNIVLSTNSYTMTEGETYRLTYTLFPDNASDYGFSWQSADSSVATVNSIGKITAMKEGQTTISLSNKDGFMATCSITVNKAKPNLQKIYNMLNDSYYCTINSNGTSLTIDTNPLNIKSYSSSDALNYVILVNDTLELSGLTEQMEHTRALDGRQSETFDSLTVTWSYHPDQGLNVVYTVK